MVLLLLYFFMEQTGESKRFLFSSGSWLLEYISHKFVTILLKISAVYLFLLGEGVQIIHFLKFLHHFSFLEIQIREECPENLKKKGLRPSH
jgi:hypothetical protein